MLAVTRLRPERVAWTDVVTLFLKGSYDAAVAASRSYRDSRAATLRARAYIRLDRYEKAFEELDRRTDDEQNVVRGEFASIRSLAFAYLGRFEDARLAQVDARAYLFSVDAPALEAELHVNEAKLAFIEGDIQSARRLSQKVLGATGGTDVPELIDGSGLTSTTIALADAGNILAALDSAADQRTSAVSHLTTSLNRVCSSEVVDIGMRAKVLANLSGSLEGVELELERSTFRLVRQVYKTITWTSELAVEQFHVIRELGLASALDGDHLSAFREYKRAFNVAPTSQLRLQALLDRVFLGEELKQHLVAHADLLEAQELATTVDWAHVEERDLGCLPTLAMLLAPINLGAARGILQSYSDRKAKSLRTSSQFIDKRFHGEYLLAIAAIARAEHRQRDAERASEAAFEIFEALGIGWRATQAAFDLRVNGDERYDDYVRAQASLRPNSWLASKAADS